MGIFQVLGQSFNEYQLFCFTTRKYYGSQRDCVTHGKPSCIRNVPSHSSTSGSVSMVILYQFNYTSTLKASLTPYLISSLMDITVRVLHLKCHTATPPRGRNACS